MVLYMEVCHSYSWSFAMKILLSFCLRCLSRATSWSWFFCKSWQRITTSGSLTSYLTVSLLDPCFLLSTSKHSPCLSSFDCIFVYCISGKQAFLFPHWKVWRSCHCHVLKQKQQCNCIQCCHGHLVVPSTFAVVPILCKIVILQSNLETFLAKYDKM